jgi:hypothetical protein
MEIPAVVAWFIICPVGTDVQQLDAASKHILTATVRFSYGIYGYGYLDTDVDNRAAIQEKAGTTVTATSA